jgi:hypothetical protein
MTRQLRPGVLLSLAAIGVAAMVGGCVAYPAYPAYGDGYGGSYDYGAPYVAYGGGWHGWHRDGWHHDGWHDGWRR